MSKPRFKLRLVNAERPLAPLSRAEKLAQAKAYLQRRGIYILDQGSPKPRWGTPGEPPRILPAVEQRGVPNFLQRIAERFATAWHGK